MAVSPRDREIDPRDQLDVLDLIAEYSWTYDSCELSAFASLFTPDGVLETPVGGGKGRDEIEAWAVARWAEMRALDRAPRHFQTNTRVARVDRDTLRGTTQLLLIWIDTRSGAAELKGAAIYHDEFRRTDAGWRFRQRRIGLVADPDPQA